MIPRHYLDFSLGGAGNGAGLPPPAVAGAALKVLHGAFNLKTSVEPTKTPFALSPVEGWTGFWQAHPMGEPVVGRSCFDKLSTNGLPHTSTEVFRFKQQPGRYALALPNFEATPFAALRVFAGEREHLDHLADSVETHPVMRDYALQGRIRKVPEPFDGAWREYRRYRIPTRRACRKPNDDLRERRMARADAGRFPYFILNSRSTGQQFGLYVEILSVPGDSGEGGKDAQPDSYGLSVSSRPFALPDIL